MMAYVTIGNSDGKLGHREWEEFYQATRNALRICRGEVVGEWRRDVAPFVNACLLYEMPDSNYRQVRDLLARLAHEYGQDTIGLAWTTSELIEAVPG